MNVKASALDAVWALWWPVAGPTDMTPRPEGSIEARRSHFRHELPI